MKLKMLFKYTDDSFYYIRGTSKNKKDPTILRFPHDYTNDYKLFYLVKGNDEFYRHRNAPLKKL